MERKEIKGNVWRELCARAVEANGGYSGSYSDRCALSWNVGLYAQWPSFDATFAKVYAQGLVSQDEGYDSVLLQELVEKWDDDDFAQLIWDRVLEDMRSGVTDADTYRTVRPEIAARYGLPYCRFPKKYKRYTNERAFYPAKFEMQRATSIHPEWILVDPYTVEMFKVRWEFQGRGGKHLCLTEFEGGTLEMTSRDLAQNIRDDTGADYSNAWCQKLVAFIHECDLCFTCKNVDSEFEYQCAFQLSLELEEISHKTAAKVKEAAERQFWNERDTVTV